MVERLLDAAAPAVLAYATETVVAEKLEAIVVLGDRNSRIKDFFDLHMLATTFAFDRRTLVDAVGRTFERRRTPIPMETPIGLRAEYWTNPSRPAQTRAFARRAGVDVPDDGGVGIGALLAEFLWPVLRDLREHNTPDSHWVPGGPWESDGQQSVPVYKD